MILRNSLSSIFRSKGKTALFTLLIFALTLALALGISVWASVAQFLEDCDDYFTTIGLIEYMGTEYPNDLAYDPSMAKVLKSLDSEVIKADDATLLWDNSARTLGYVDGFWRTDLYMPSRMLSVFVLGNVSYNEEDDMYSGIVMKSLYSFKIPKSAVIYIDRDFGEFEPDRYYLVFGELYQLESPMLHLRVAELEATASKALGVEVPRITDITADGKDGVFFTIPEETVLRQIAATLPLINNSVLVNGTDNLMSLLPFHQEELFFVQGRAFTEEEYVQGEHVAVISELMAARLKIGVGDIIQLATIEPNSLGLYANFWSGDDFSSSSTYKVVGIINTIPEKSWYVYVPKDSGIPWSTIPIGYTVGQVLVRNKDAAEFLARMEPLLDNRLILTLYDQGYAALAIPFTTILRVAKIITAVCILMELSVILMFGFLFVYRQRETSETMLMLGTGKPKVCAYFLYSSGLIALLASTAGGITGYTLHDSVIEMVACAAKNFALFDPRYSNGNLSISRSLEFAPRLGYSLFLWVGAAVFLFCLLACLGFVIGTFLRNRPSQRQFWGPRKEHRTSHLQGGSFKYAILSIFRGGARTTVVPILAATVALFFGQLATTSLRYQEQLNSIYDNTQIDGYFTDFNGKQVGNLLLNAYNTANLYHQDYLDTLNVSLDMPYYYLGVSKLADGTEQDVEPLYVPIGFYAKESVGAMIDRGPDMVGANDIRTAPEFFYADTVLLDFLEGYDESFLKKLYTHESGSFPCLVPTSMMEKYSIRLGDTVRVALNDEYDDPNYSRKIYLQLDFVVVGSYEKQGAKDTIYIPLSLMFDTELLWEEGQLPEGRPLTTFETGYKINTYDKRVLQMYGFRSTYFKLTDSRSLDEFIEYLADYGYSQVKDIGRIREFIVLRDASFNNAVASVKQQIRYINTLYPCLYVLVGIIALVVSYLLVVCRKKEFATMRGLGATKTRSFLSFFLEQSFLCIFGTLIGLTLWTLLWGKPIQLHLLLTAGFLACYFIGSAISVTIMNQSNVLTILSDKD